MERPTRVRRLRIKGGREMHLKQMCRLFALTVVCRGLLYPQAQISSGDLSGTVTDARGAALYGAKITASASERGITRGTESGVTGDYRIPLLTPGQYTVRVEANGFITRVFEGVAVAVGQTFRLNAQL